MPKNKKPGLELQSIIDAHPNPFVLIDEDYNIVASNQAYQTAYGTTAEQLAGCKCHKVSHHFETPCFMNNEDCPLEIALKTNRVHEVLHIHFDQHNQPEHVRIKGHPILGSDGKRYVGEEIIRLAKASELGCEEQILIGKSPALRQCVEGIARAAESDANVLLTGESGVGKSLAAHYIHHHSKRSRMPFVMVECSAIDTAVFESELFGHERGAFSGCVGRRRGLLDDADGGTLYLDEVADLPYAMQGRLCNAVESGRYRRVGGREMLKVNLRIIASTHKHLPAMVAANTFRSDLYYRLAGIIERLPPLRQRREDIPALADALLIRLHDPKAFRCHIADAAREKLISHDYPGNIRELKNILQRAVTLSTDGLIRAEHILFERLPETPGGDVLAGLPRSMKQLKSEHITALLEKYKGHRGRIAAELGISERTLYRKLKEYALKLAGAHDGVR
jgi:transcriptional regulator with PAS, ATPase and Fis domain